MKVVFWNAIRESDNVTGYVAAIGTILSLEYHCEVVLSSNYISNHMLQDCFFCKIKEEGSAHAPYRYLYDSPEYYSALWNMKRSRQGDILEIPVDGVTIVFPPDVAEKSMFYYEVPENSFYLLDVAGESSAYVQDMLEEAEVIVVFLPQDEIEIQKFFYRFSSLIPKAIFVIEESYRITRVFYRKMVAEYGINYRNIGSIPQNKEYTDACEDGKLESFLRQKQAANSSQYSFIMGIRYVAQLLHERKMHQGRKECETHQSI